MLFMLLLIGCASLCVDMSVLYVRKQALQDGVDAAALAGAAKLYSKDSDRDARLSAENVGQANGITAEKLQTSICPPDFHVSASEDVKLAFARIFNLSKDPKDPKAQHDSDKKDESMKCDDADKDPNCVKISAMAVATRRPVNVIRKALRPFGLDVRKINDIVPDTLTVLKQGARGGFGGNFQALALTGHGANSFKDTIVTGTMDPVRVGDSVMTEPGNMVGPTDMGVASLIDQASQAPWNSQTPANCTIDNPRVIPVPICDYKSGKNGRTSLKVVGFAAVYLASSVKGEVTGVFLSNINIPAGDYDPGIPLAFNDPDLPNNHGIGLGPLDPTLKKTILKQ
jgi:hypothetical protein